MDRAWPLKRAAKTIWLAMTAHHDFRVLLRQPNAEAYRHLPLASGGNGTTVAYPSTVNGVNDPALLAVDALRTPLTTANQIRSKMDLIICTLICGVD